MVVDIIIAADSVTMENGPAAVNANPRNITAPPSPPSATVTATSLPANGGGLSSRSPSSLNLKNTRCLDEAARSSIAAFAHQQAPLLAAMFAQRFIHVTNQTGIDVDALHSHFLGEFLPAFLECLHSSMTSSSSVDCCDMCSELSQRTSFLAVCQTSMPPQQQPPQTPTSVNGSSSSFQHRSNSVSFGGGGGCGGSRGGKNSPPLSLTENSPCTPSPLESTVHTASIYSLNKAAHSGNSGNGSAMGSKIKHFIGQFVRRRTVSTNNREGNNTPLPSETPGLSSPALSLSVDVVIEGVLELHTKAPNSNPTGTRSGLSNSRDLLTSIPQQSELDDADDSTNSKEDTDSASITNHSAELTKSTEFLADSPWLPCHARLLRSSAGPLLVLSYSPDVNLPPCGISMSSISEVRAATIGDALTSDDHAFILISSSLSCRVLLKASSRADMNRWLDALRPCVAFHPAAMVPLFPVNKFGLAVPSRQDSTGSNAGIGRFGSFLGNISSHLPQTETPTSKNGASDNLARSTSFVGRRRIQTSPAVDLQQLIKNNKGHHKHTESASVKSATPSEINAGSRTHSTETTTMPTPPRPLSPATSQTLPQPPQQQQQQQPQQPSSVQVQGQSSTQQQQQQQQNATRPLNTYPWYWGPISRHEASEVVCKFGESGSGCFVVRQSESQQGDYVITFNCDGEAKHLRLKVYADGRCQMNQFAFTSVQALVDHFRTNALPIDLGNNVNEYNSSGQANGVMLTNYVSRRPMTPAQPTVKG